MWFERRNRHDRQSGSDRKFYIHTAMTLVLCSYCILSVLCSAAVSKVRAAKTDTLHIVLDPGHGGSQSGAARGSVEEKDLNLKIAEYLKEALEQYENVTVSLTRSGDYTVELLERTEIALSEDADVLISLHNNAAGGVSPYYNGCTVLAAKGDYASVDADKEEMVLEEQKLACNILNELSALGLEDQGILLRDSESGDTYEDGTLADYYAIIRNGVKYDLPSILIEHAFLDDNEDYEDFLSSDEKLQALAEADARGIARYYQLQEKDIGEVLLPLTNFREKIVHAIDGNAEHNEVSYKTYYTEEEDDSENTAEEIEENESDGRMISEEEMTSGTTTEEETMNEVAEDGLETEAVTEHVIEEESESLVDKGLRKVILLIVLAMIWVVLAIILIIFYVRRRRKNRTKRL